MGLRRNAITLLLLVPALVPIAPAKPSPAKLRSEARAALDRGDPFTAVDLLLWIPRDRVSRRTRELLARARSRAGEIIVAEIDKIIDAEGIRGPETLVSRSQVTRLTQLLERLEFYDPDNARNPEIRTLVAEGTTVLDQRERALLERCDRGLQSLDWRVVVEARAGLERLNPDSQMTQSCSTRADERAREHFNRRLSELDSAGNLAELQALCRQATEVLPETTWNACLTAAEAGLQASSMVSRGDYEGALAVLADHKDSPLAAVTGLLEAIRSEYAKRLYAEAADLLSRQNSYWEGLARLRMSAKHGHAKAAERLAAERDDAVARLRKKVASWDSEQRPGRALLAIQRYATAFGDRSTFASEVERCRTRLQRRWPRGISVEIAMQQVDSCPGSTVREALHDAVRRRLGVLMLDDSPLRLALTATDCQVTRSTRSRTEETRYVSAYNETPNPEWAAWRQRRLLIEEKLAEKDSDDRLLGTMAADLIDPEPPRVLKEPVYATHAYTVRTTTLQAHMAGAARLVLELFDGWTVELLRTHGKGTFKTSDEAHDAFPPGEVDADPLELPSDSAAIEKSVQELAEKILPARSALEKRIREAVGARARELVANGQHEEAIEYAMTMLVNGAADDELVRWLKSVDPWQGGNREP